MTTGRVFALILAAILFATVFLPSVRRFGTAALPLRLHNVAWATALGLFSLPLIAYTPLTLTAWTYIALGITSFHIGVAVCLARAPKRTARLDLPRRRPWMLEWMVPVLFLIGSLLYLRAIDQVFGIATFISQPNLARSQLGSEAFKAAYSVPCRILFGLGPLCFVTYAVPSITGIVTSQVRRTVVLLASTIFMAASLGRTLLLVSFVWTGMVFVLAGPARTRRRSMPSNRRNSGAKTLILTAAAGLALFQLVAVLLGKTSQSDQRIQPYVSSMLRGSQFTSVVTYLTGGIPSFGILIKGEVQGLPNSGYQERTSNGKIIVAPAAKVLGLNPPDEVRPFSDNPLPNNAYTYLDAFWLDFRGPGIILGPMVLGFILTYMAARRPRSRERLVVNGLLFSLILWVPFGYKFGETFTWASVLMLALSAKCRPQRLPLAPITTEDLTLVAD